MQIATSDKIENEFADTIREAARLVSKKLNAMPKKNGIRASEAEIYEKARDRLVELVVELRV